MLGTGKKQKLWAAVKKGQTETVHDIIARSSDKGKSINVNDPLKKKRTLLFVAASRDYDAIVKLLIDAGADVNILSTKNDMVQWSPLSVAAKNNFGQVVKLLLDAGAKPDEVFEISTSYGQDVEVDSDEEGIKNVPLNASTSNIFATEDPPEDSAKGNKALRVSVDNVKSGLRASFRVSGQVLRGSGGLHVANSPQQSPRRLSDSTDGSPRLRTIGEKSKKMTTRTPLLCAVENDRIDITQMLIDARADTSFPNHDGSTPLHFAALAGHAQIVDLLLKNHANKDAVEQATGFTPLHAAVKAGQNEIVRLLLYSNTNFHLADKENNTPFILALTHNNMEVAKLLITAGADVNGRSLKNGVVYQGVNPIVAAAKAGNVEMVQLLLSSGADANGIESKSGMNGLHAAVKFPSVIKILLQAGTSVNACDRYNSTPLHYAAEQGYFDSVTMLVDANANVSVRNYGGQTPSDLGDKYPRILSALKRGK